MVNCVSVVMRQADADWTRPSLVRHTAPITARSVHEGDEADRERRVASSDSYYD